MAKNFAGFVRTDGTFRSFEYILSKKREEKVMNEALIRTIADFKQYHDEQFSWDFRRWFKVGRGFAGKPVNFVLHAQDTITPQRPAKYSDSIFHEHCFSVACFFTSLIPQIIAEKEDGKELFFDYALASGWPIINCGSGGLLSAVQVVFEADLLPNDDELDDYSRILEAAEIYFANDIRSFLAGGEDSLNRESYLRVCENVKDRIDEICIKIHSRTQEYLHALKDDAPYEFKVVQWRGHSKYTMHLPQNIYRDRRDGQVYRFVKIGDQIWMSENLRYKTDDAYAYQEWDTDEATLVRERGLLYTWDAANRVAPPGWRLPSNEDFRKLYDYVKSHTQTPVGKALKTKDLWLSGAGTDEFGFNAMPTGTGETRIRLLSLMQEGRREISGKDDSKKHNFILLNVCTQFWTTDQEDSQGCYWTLDHYHDDFKMLPRVKTDLFSVRLIKE